MTKRVAKLTKAGLPKQSGAKPGEWGVKNHVPTDEMRDTVMKYVAVGCTGRQLEVLLNLSQQTLARDYAHEVEHGRMVKIAKLGKSIYERAIEGDTSAAKFVLDRQGRDFGWGAKQELSGPKGGPIRIDLSGYSDEELALIEPLLAQIASGQSIDDTDAGEGGEG